ncbi:histone PARylation factor 1 [Bombina bombina]|uniref:histone PARylation factor 1 n=1 Tax=Bombina bombina TaxID=8345 RepID=UPI00235AA70A|nr:histone PARylation factor 1 [Bombina bombina]
MTSLRKRARTREPVMAGGGKRKKRVDQQCEDVVDSDAKKKCNEKPSVPESLRQEVESLYRLTMPKDFYNFWAFCSEIDSEAPCDVLKSSLGLQLVGPYDILSSKHKSAKKASDVNYNLHWRFFYDPPEFQTIIVGDSGTQFHMGYFR